MIKVAVRMVNPEHEQTLRDWFAELTRRRDEVRETFKQETVRHEQCYLVPTPAGSALLYIIEAEDHDKGREAYKTSTLPIDLEHRDVMKKALGAEVPAELLFDCSAD